MSKLTELLDELCPDGVEYRPLGQLGKRNKGMVITASRMKELHQEGGEVRIFAGGHTIADVDRDDLPGTAVIDVPSIIVKSRGNIGFEYHTKPFTHKNELWSYTLDDPDVDQKFIFYYLQSQVGYFQLKAKSGKLPQIGVRDTDHFSIPVPPLEVQQEIVRALDAFTDLEQSLVSELELRKKQYDEYRTEAIKSLDRVDCRALGDVVQIRNGRDWKTQKPGDIPVYGSGGRMPRGVASPSSVGPTVLLPRKGSLEVQYVNEPIWNVDTVFTTACDPEVLNTRFFFHTMKTLDLGRISTSATRPSLTQSALRKLSIPVPPLDVQQEIVAKLDTFDSLIQSIEQEITLRRTQYEFYRDELLSFTPKKD